MRKIEQRIILELISLQQKTLLTQRKQIWATLNKLLNDSLERFCVGRMYANGITYSNLI